MPDNETGGRRVPEDFTGMIREFRKYLHESTLRKVIKEIEDERQVLERRIKNVTDTPE